MANFASSDESDPLYTYNAIQMSARQVAQSFVAPEAFRTLIRHDNAILSGPRGSGKTTLLKMMQSEALELWAQDEAEEARRIVRSTGVFVGVDKMWSEQLRVSPSANSDAFGVGAYALHIGRSLTRAMGHRTAPVNPADEIAATHLRVNLSPRQIANVCARIAKLFQLPYSTPTFAATAQTLGDRLTELGSYRHRLLQVSSLPDWAYLDPIQAVSEIAEQFNEYAGNPEHKWSLLFDEMELAPTAIVRDVLSGLRGNQERLTFKISLAPILRETDLLTGERGATHGQDVEFIPLTSAVRGDSTRFVRTLIERQMYATSSDRPSVWRVFGESAFDNGEGAGRSPSQRPSPYRPNSALVNDMRYLRQNDPTFAAYLVARGVDLDNLEQMKDDDRASTVRKIRNLVVVRAYYRKSGSRRSRKSLELYAGASSLLSFPDGNPRMATILARRLTHQRELSPNGRVTPARQAAAIEEVANRFMALLNAQVGVLVEGRPTTVVHLLDRVGSALADRIVMVKFSADVAAGFFVDESTRPENILLLTQAVNTGAIVHMPRRADESTVSDSPLGRHYRLSYLLAPRYGLPLRTGKTIALSALLSEPKQPRSATHRKRVAATPEDAYLDGMEPEK